MDPLATVGDDDVGALLALIDKVYTSQRTAGAHDIRERRRYAAAQRQELLAQVEELQRHLDLARQRFDVDDAIYGTRLWRPVALGQQSQRESVERENAKLKRVVRRQIALTQRVAAVLEDLQAMLRHATPTNGVLAQSGPCSPIPALFVSRLDAVCGRVAARPVKITNCYTREHKTQWDDSQTVLHYRFRSRGQYPFQLSIVVDEFWRGLHEQIPTTSPAQDEVYYAETTFEMRKPYGWVDVQGPRATRRVYTPEGGVILVSVATMAGSKSENNNLMAGLEMHETVMVRLLRADASNPRSPVFVESVTEFEVLSSPQEEGGLHTRAALERFQAFIETYAAEDRGEGRQELENRLLDASLSQGRPA